MEVNVTSRLRSAWNAFRNKDPTYSWYSGGGGYFYRPDRIRFSSGNDRRITTPVCNRIAMDAAAISVQQVRLDEDGRFLETMNTGLNNCLTLEANLDQTGRAFMQDVVASMLDEGCVGIVPVDIDDEPEVADGFDVLTLRTGQILEWCPSQVRIRVYNEATGEREDILLPKSKVGIVENPLYAVMNEPNSTMQRLIRKLNLADRVDNQIGSDKLDLVIQLPYVVKGEIKRRQAETRRADIERQLAGSKYGLAYVDSAERITQLNRPVENTLTKQVESLTSMLYSQLGITQSILDGTADDKTMQNYYTRTIEPILSAITDEIKRKFLTPKARAQRQSILFFRDPFKLVPPLELAEIADKLTRNEIVSSNEIRQKIGMKPSDDPRADKLENKNLRSPGKNQPVPEHIGDNASAKEENSQNEV